MEDRYVMIKIKPDMGSGSPVVIHGVLDGHGGEVRHGPGPVKNSGEDFDSILDQSKRLIFIT